MSLPKLKHPMHDILIPSLNKKQPFRSWLVKEEKILLTAQQSEDDAMILKAIKAIVSNCSLETLDVNALTTYDIEWLFMKLRAVSVNNIIKASYKDNEDEKVYDFKIDIEDIELKYPKEKVDNTIKLSDDVVLTLRHPSGSDIDKIDALDNKDAAAVEMFAIKCALLSVFQGDSEYSFSEYTDAEVVEFVEELPVSALQSIRDFINNMPYLYYKIEYKNSKDNDRSIELSSIRDFFIWG